MDEQLILERFFEEFYQGQVEGSSTDYVIFHWDSVLKLFSDNHFVFDYLIETISTETKEVYYEKIDELFSYLFNRCDLSTFNFESKSEIEKVKEDNEKIKNENELLKERQNEIELLLNQLLKK